MRPMNSSKNKLNSKIIYNFHPNPNAHLVCVWIAVGGCAFAFSSFYFLLRSSPPRGMLFINRSCALCTRPSTSLTAKFSLRLHYLVCPVHCSRDPQISFFNKTFIKNGSHSTIHTFKNYFATVFSVFSKISGIQTDP